MFTFNETDTALASKILSAGRNAAVCQEAIWKRLDGMDAKTARESYRPAMVEAIVTAGKVKPGTKRRDYPAHVNAALAVLSTAITRYGKAHEWPAERKAGGGRKAKTAGAPVASALADDNPVTACDSALAVLATAWPMLKPDERKAVAAKIAAILKTK